RGQLDLHSFPTRRSSDLQKDAIAEYEYAARISALDPLPRNKLAWILATSSDASIRDGSRAVELANEAVRLSHGKDPNYLRTLAADRKSTRLNSSHLGISY